jgi:tetratricopeptide (TPR) repeat protein
MTRSTTRIHLLIAAMFIGITPLSVASAQSKSTTLDDDERHAVVERIGRLLDESYIFPDVAAKSGEHIARQLKSGAFDTITDPKEFADRLTGELQSISHDRHMRVRVKPPEVAMQDRSDPMAERSRYMRDMRESNYGFQRVERLEGNIGYLDLRGFMAEPAARQTAIAAMQLLAGSDAVIIDLRKNGGGDPNTVRLICSYFFQEPTHLNSLYHRSTDTTEEFWTLKDVPGQRMADVPLYILTSSYTFSGAEEFTYDMQSRKRATIIGETTGGGANPGGSFPVNDRFAIFIPTGRAINPVTKGNWEGTGVKPEIAIDAAHALDTALALARSAAERRRDAMAAKERASHEAVAAGIARAKELFRQKKNAEGTEAINAALDAGRKSGVLNEEAINMMGYRYLGTAETQIAIAVLAYNVAAYPESSNVYDSLGEAYMKDGQKDLAITNYRKSLELEPKNENARQMLAKMGVDANMR